MTTRIAGAILGLLLAAAAAHAQTVLIPMSPADFSEQPTSMPDGCADLDVNCVLNDGPPRWVPHRATEGPSAGPPIPATGATAGAGAMNGFAGAAASSGSPGFAGRR
jgi:hypothetical protein